MPLCGDTLTGWLPLRQVGGTADRQPGRPGSPPKARYFKGSRGGRLVSWPHARLKRASHTWINYYIYHFRAR